MVDETRERAHLLLNALEAAKTCLEQCPIYVTFDGVWFNARPDAKAKIGGAMIKVEGVEADVFKHKKAQWEAAIALIEKAIQREI
jgi:hypothetical protein